MKKMRVSFRQKGDVPGHEAERGQVSRWLLGRMVRSGGQGGGRVRRSKVGLWRRDGGAVFDFLGQAWSRGSRGGWLITLGWNAWEGAVGEGPNREQ